jgi:hypothetical protein
MTRLSTGSKITNKQQFQAAAFPIVAKEVSLAADFFAMRPSARRKFGGVNSALSRLHQHAEGAAQMFRMSERLKLAHVLGASSVFAPVFTALRRSQDRQ